MRRMTEKKQGVLPVHRRQLAFASKVERAPSSSTRHWASRLKESTLGSAVLRIWHVCTTTLDGSLSETFKLVSSDDSDGISSASGRQKPVAVESDGESLNAVVVDHDDTDDHKPIPQHASDSSQRSGQGGSNSTGPQNYRYHYTGVDNETNGHYTGGFKSWLLDRIWPEIVLFFEPKFPADTEKEYQTVTWHSTKFLAFCASLFLVLNWALYLALNNDSNSKSTYGRMVYWVGLTIVTIPTPFMIAVDMPRRAPVMFQIFFAISVWYCAFSEVIQMYECQFFRLGKRNCNGKDFLAMSYYSTALPALMLLIVSKRIYNAIAQLAFFILLLVLIIPDQTIYARNVVSFVVFSIFIQGLDYMMEDARRKMFLLALQLKQAYKSKHKARQAESKASYMKRRFANYIFHEVRVPLNNAVLAFQLLQSGDAFQEHVKRSTEVYALEQGLKMMKTVLNDVLDFEKMDSGHFETIAKPFPLHHSIRAILDQVEVQTNAKNLVLERALDDRIDSAGMSVEPGRSLEPEGLWVLGSELRLHQILVNLAQNAVKYTPEGGGGVRISTEFLGITNREELPEVPPETSHGVLYKENHIDGRRISLDGDVSPPISDATQRPVVFMRTGSGTILTPCLNFRLEVHDAGPGIKPSDLVEDRLFQPFVQTTVGQSTGSGTGLGLAIVKQIVRLSGGRLGVISRRGQGSKFWIELSYPLASAAEVQAARDANTVSRKYDERREKMFISRPLMASPLPPPDTASAFAAAASASAESTMPLQPPRFQKNVNSSEATLQETITPAPAPKPPVPETPDLPPAAPLTPIVPAAATASQLRVLVVDDDSVTRVLSSKLLTKLGCIVQTAKDGQECVDMVLASAPYTFDLICLDNFMPEKTGEEAVKEIRAQGREEFVVGCTGNALTEDQESYRDAGADDVVVKPVMIHDFKRLIQVAEQRRRARARMSPTPFVPPL
ncbi:Histidine kinase domain-containing protein [Mycena kentingensis (nom. inval.)]|nr:Histidine kinase domain-containing protein [Mycena kentingensis (nom. inval.)]